MGSSPSPTSPSAAMHPISMSLLHSSSPSSSHHHPHHPHHSFYGGATTPTLGASTSGSVHSPSPLKRSRHNHIINNNNNSNSSAMEEWLPSPGQMSVDSMSPPPPPSSSSMSMRGAADGLLLDVQQQQQQQQQLQRGSTLPPSVISSSNGYSPSPMSTGSYEPPFSPGGGGGGKLGQSQPRMHFYSCPCCSRTEAGGPPPFGNRLSSPSPIAHRPSPLIEESSDRSAFYKDSVKRAVRLCNTLSCVCVSIKPQLRVTITCRDG